MGTPLLRLRAAVERLGSNATAQIGRRWEAMGDGAK